jgi:uncharacterized protein YjbI with pentapeptide repeats
MASKRDTRSRLSRSDFEEEFAQARAEKRPPQLTGSAEFGLDLSGLDFTSEYADQSGHIGDCIGIDLRHAILRNCNLRRCDVTNANLRDADLSGSDLKGTSLYNTLFEGAKLLWR